jgi:mRNA-degrading endonuclease toxin of MazEF toxin-antitoxin module
MSKLNVHNLISVLKDNFINKKQKASTSPVIRSELENLFQDMETMLLNQNIEESVKYILWQGLLNRYGIFGYDRNTVRMFGVNKTSYSDKTYKRGDVLSIDFGASNLGNEFSYTHLGIVINDYTDYSVIVPLTSFKEERLESKPEDQKNATMLLYKEDYNFLEDDSLVLIYQIRSISKNRITKYIGRVDDSEFFDNIFSKMFKMGIDKQPAT